MLHGVRGHSIVPESVFPGDVGSPGGGVVYFLEESEAFGQDLVGDEVGVGGKFGVEVGQAVELLRKFALDLFEAAVDFRAARKIAQQPLALGAGLHALTARKDEQLDRIEMPALHQYCGANFHDILGKQP